MLLEIWQNSQENTCARVSFLIKLQAFNFIKKETLAQVFFSVNFAKFFKNTFFIEHLTTTASVSCITCTCVRLSVETLQQWCSRVRLTRSISLDAKVVANALYSTNFCNVYFLCMLLAVLLWLLWFLFFVVWCMLFVLV